jgi:RNA polymerase sigma-70 factor, ECF subfamily
MILTAENAKTDQTPSDNDLLRCYLDGQEEAFATIVKRYRRELYNFLVRFTGDAALAEDVFQETFLQLHVSAATFDLDRRLKPWMFTIAANKARDAMRSRWRKRAAPLDATMGGENEDGSSYADLMPSDIPAPDEAMLNSETRQAVQNIVNDMPESLRVVLLMSYFHEFPYKEIAEMLDVPLGTIKSRLHAAIKLFAKKWKASAGRLGHDRS